MIREITIRWGRLDHQVVGDMQADAYGLRKMKAQGIEVRRAVDVGAFIGASAMLIKDTWPATDLLAFEPWPENFSLLVRNVADMPGVQVRRQAVVADDGVAQMFQALQERCGRIIGSASVDPGRGNVEVAAVGVESIFDLGKPIDLLKMDCEGSEYVILDALAKRNLMQFVRHIRGEWHWGDCPQRWAHIEAMLKVTHKVQFRPGRVKRLGKFQADIRSQ